MTPRWVFVLAMVGGLAACKPSPGRVVGPSVVPVASAPPKAPAPPPRPCEEGLGASLDVRGAEDTPIVDVCVTGGAPDTIAAVKKALRLGLGKTLTAAALRSDLEAAFETGMLDQIVATARESGAGAVVFLTLTEQPRITAVAFDGLVSLAGDPVIAAFPKPGALLHRGAFHAAAERLRDEYSSRGWDEAKVDYVLTPVATGVQAKVTVKEGTRARVGKVTFDGARGGREVGLRRAIELEDGGPLFDDRLARAGLLVSMFYWELGFLNVRVAEPKRTRGPDGVTAISFAITEGPMFRVGKLSVDGVPPDVQKQILAGLQVKTGEVFKRSKLVADMDAISAQQRKQGSAVTVEPRTELDPKTSIVDIALVISPNHP